MIDLLQIQKPDDITGLKLTAKEAILVKCWDCCCYDRAEVKLCDNDTCPLMPLKNKWYRLPRRKIKK